METMNKDQAVELFHDEAILFGTTDAIPEYRVLELFGQPAAEFISRTLKYDGYMKSGTDWNGWGSCEPGRPLIRYYYLSGFLKIVSESNYLLTLEFHKESKGGALSDKMWAEREERLDAKKKKK